MMEKRMDEIVLAVESKNNKVLLESLYSLYRYKRPIKCWRDRFNMFSKIQLSDDTGNPVGRCTITTFTGRTEHKAFSDKVCSVVALLLPSPYSPISHGG
ncbi:MAG: hypothetical protein ACLR6J_14835 [Parabacteroides merdae]